MLGVPVPKIPSESPSAKPASRTSLHPSPSESRSILFGIPSPSKSSSPSTVSRIPSLSSSKSTLFFIPSPSGSENTVNLETLVTRFV